MGLELTTIKATAIARAEPKAIDTWRSMASDPNICKGMSETEYNVFQASVRKQMREYSDTELLPKWRKVLDTAVALVGYRNNNKAEWAIQQTQLFGYLKKYYGGYTLADVGMAFQLTAIGELDEYFPTDSNGNPDNKHYQMFSLEYFGRVMRAYGKKQNEVMEIAYKKAEALPKPASESKQYYDELDKQAKRLIFLRYKYQGKLEFDGCNDMRFYDWLCACGLATDFAITLQDRRTAYNQYMQEYVKGLRNIYEAGQVRKEGETSAILDGKSMSVAREKAIRKALAEMVAEEIQIDNYLK